MAIKKSSHNSSGKKKTSDDAVKLDDQSIQQKGPQNIKIFKWQMENFQVMLSDSDNIMVALMLDADPSDAVKKALINFTYLFESNYEQPIKNFKGKLSVFNSVRPLAEDIFNLFLMQPQMLPMDIKKLNMIKLDSDEKKLIRSAQSLQQERGYFFFTHLISEHLKKTKISQNKMFKMIFDLHNKGVFISIAPEHVSKEINRCKLFKKICDIRGISNNDLQILLKDLLASSPESQEVLINKIKEYKKKDMSENIQNEILDRNTLRKQRSELFGQIDGFLQASDYNNVVNIFEQIIKISNDLGDFKMANELNERAQQYKQAIDQMTTVIPQIRSARNDALNKAELYELAGKYIDASESYKKAASYSMELGELEEAKEYENHVERMLSLEELAKLRRSLGA